MYSDLIKRRVEKEMDEIKKRDVDVIRMEKRGYVFFGASGFLVQLLVCYVGRLTGWVSWKAFIVLPLLGALSFMFIYKYKFGLIKSMLFFPVINISALFVTYWAGWNVVNAAGFFGELLVLFLGMVFAYLIGCKNYVEGVVG